LKKDFNPSMASGGAGVRNAGGEGEEGGIIGGIGNHGLRQVDDIAAATVGTHSVGQRAGERPADLALGGRWQLKGRGVSDLRRAQSQKEANFLMDADAAGTGGLIIAGKHSACSARPMPRLSTSPLTVGSPV
jgi:hypothetical protein